MVADGRRHVALGVRLASLFPNQHDNQGGPGAQEKSPNAIEKPKETAPNVRAMSFLSRLKYGMSLLNVEAVLAVLSWQDDGH